MPIYEYRCTKCGTDFEDIVGVNDPAPACPECANPKTEKLLSKACFRSGGVVVDGGDGVPPSSYASGSGSGCAGCSGGNCASCG